MNGPMFGEGLKRKSGECSGAMKHKERPIDHSFGRKARETDALMFSGPLQWPFPRLNLKEACCKTLPATQGAQGGEVQPRLPKMGYLSVRVWSKV